MITTISTEQVACVPDEPGVTMRELVERWQRGDLSAARPLIDCLGSTLRHVISTRDVLAYQLSVAQAEVMRLKADTGSVAYRESVPHADRPV